MGWGGGGGGKKDVTRHQEREWGGVGEVGGRRMSLDTKRENGVGWGRWGEEGCH